MKYRVGLTLVACAAVVGAGVWAFADRGASAKRPAAAPTHSITTAPSPTPSVSKTVDASLVVQAAATRGMHLVFDKSFAGHPLDRSAWATCYPWIVNVASGCTNFGNTELQWYLPTQDRVRGASLHIAAQPIATQGRTQSGGAKTYSCRSGMITSFPSFRFTYGYVSVVARVPAGPGLWSGLWLAAADEHWPPEIDLLESWGPPGNVAGVYLHTISTRKHAIEKHLTPAMLATLSSGWHTFGLLWTSNLVTWYIDGQQILVVRNHSPQQPMYFVADLADFKQVPQGCNGQLLIKSVQIWQRPAG